MGSNHKVAGSSPARGAMNNMRLLTDVIHFIGGLEQLKGVWGKTMYWAVPGTYPVPIRYRHRGE